jgi:hypothetical protein
VFFAGGHGTMSDFPTNRPVQNVVEYFWRHNRPLGLVCHGPAALVGARTADGAPLVAGRRLTAFSNAEERAVKLTNAVPFLLQSKLDALGAKVETAADFTGKTIVDGLPVTGQNPASSEETARRLLATLNDAARSTAMSQSETPEARDAAWLTEFQQAKDMAAQRDVPILANVAGSDWCGWCIRLDEQSFSKPAIQPYAAQNLVLFLADFPQRKAQTQDVVQQNQSLMRNYGVRGFPTVLLLDADGQVLGRTGYRRGGAEADVTHINKLVK